MKKQLLFVSILLLGLVSCNSKGSTSSNPISDSTEKEEKTKFYYNLPGREDEVYENVSTDEKEPSHPIVNGYLFQGWYTEKSGGTRFNFASSLKWPDKLYAHWSNYNQMSKDEQLEAFIDVVSTLSGEVNHTIGDVSMSYQSSMASDQIFTGTDAFIADRYSDMVHSSHYSPYYAKSDEVVSDDDQGMTAAEVNKRNHRLDIDDYYENGNYYNVYNYDKNFSGYNAVDNADGYTKTKMDEESANNQMSIDFTSYFMGTPSLLLSYMQKEHEFTELTGDTEADKDVEGDYYYLEGTDASRIDPYSSKNGASFEVDFAVSTKTNSGYLVTNIYNTKANVAFKNSKIAYCQVYRSVATALNSEILELYTYECTYEFTQGSYEDRVYEGKKLSYKGLKEYTDE